MNRRSHFTNCGSPTDIARRWFLKECGVGLGAAALAELLGTQSAHAAAAAANPLDLRPAAG